MAGSQEKVSNNSSQFVSFRVFVYRLNLSGSWPIGPDWKEFEINRLLRMDTFDPDYPMVAREFENDSDMEGFLGLVRDKITAGLAVGPQRLLDNDSIFERIEITPLVASVNTQLTINGDNSCSITMVDSAFSDFGIGNIVSASRMGPVFRDLKSLPPTDGLSKSGKAAELEKRAAASAGYQAAQLAALRGFIMREFDLVRVEAYSRNDESWQDRAEGFLKNNISPDFTSTTAFTGLVVSINRSAGIASVPVVTASCAGMSSVFSRGTTVFDKAIAQVLSLKGGQNLKVIDTEMNTYANRFMNKSSMAVFIELINEYFFIKDVTITEASSSEKIDEKGRAMYMPDIRSDFWSRLLTFTDEAKRDRPALVQFVPMLVCYHIIKYLNLEPIAQMDDMLTDSRTFMDDPGISTRLEMPVIRSRNESLEYLKPYLTMIRTAYQLFDSSYQQPSAVLDEIRDKSFFEIFEDRSGCFHFRFPRYNMTHIMSFCDSGNTISATIQKSDSAVFNVAQAQNMLGLVGALGPRGLSPEIYFDRFSIYRFGLRMPQKVENPNALVPEMSKEIARYLSGYNSALTSRTATVVRTLDPKINVGDMVGFEVGPADKMTNSLLHSGEERSFVGYVAGISESISVSGASSQTLNLVMVRPVGQTVSDKTEETVQVTARRAADFISRKAVKNGVPRRFDLPGSALDFNLGTRLVSAYEYGGPTLISDVGLLASIARGTSTQALNSQSDETLMVDVPLSVMGARKVSFKYIPDPIYLAAFSGRTQSKLEDAVSSIRGREAGKQTARQHGQSIGAANRRVDERAQSLGAMVVFGEILSAYSLRVGLALREEDGRIVPKGSADSFIRNTGAILVRTYTEVLREKRGNIAASGRSVSLQFPGEQVPRAPQIKTSQLDKSFDQLVARAASIYTGSGKRRGGDWFKKEYDRLLKPVSGVNMQARFDDEDLASAMIIIGHFLDTYLPDEIATMSLEKANNDGEAAIRVEFLNNLRRESADAAAATKPVAASTKVPDRTGSGDPGVVTFVGVKPGNKT